MAKSPQGIAFMDSEQRRIGLWSADSIDIRGGFGTEEGGLFDPVAVSYTHLKLPTKA